MVNSKLKILFLSSWYPNRTYLTHGIFNERYAKAVSPFCNVAALFVCSDEQLRDQMYEITFPERELYTVIVYYKKVNYHVPFFSSLLKLFRYFNAYRIGLKQIKKYYGKPDLVQVNIIFPVGLIALGLKKIYNIPYVISENWTGYFPEDGNYKGVIKKFFTRRIALASDCIMTVSEDLKKMMLQHNLYNRYEIIPNVVDMNVFYPEYEKSTRHKIRIVHISSLDERQKNISGILRAIKEVSLKRDDFELVIIGNGTDRNQAEQLSIELNLLNRMVFFTGSKRESEIANLMRQANFLILFSNFENLPCVVLEALASGIPVIVTTAGGTKEYISEKTGIIIKSQDEQALSKSIAHMLNHHNEYSLQYIRAYAENNFSYEVIGKKMYQIYQSAL